MPVYTYRCSNCGVQFEKQQSFSDQSLLRCPECGKRALKKIYLPVGIVFKGSGFYATDHHSPSGMASMKADEKAEAKSEAKAEEKKESKESSESKETAAKTEKSTENSSGNSS
ncbi:MAG: zinc ribbon domain-containing protein, partial [Chloroflexi bacterium]|nr:zinc ribbon domain-containing protein [Chloroflexota bacterium]